MAYDSRTLTSRILQEIWNAKNPSLIDELYSDDCVIHTPDGEMRGIDGSKRLYQTYTSSFPDVRFEIQQIVAEAIGIRQLLRGDLDPARSRELMDEMRAAGLPT